MKAYEKLSETWNRSRYYLANHGLRETVVRLFELGRQTCFQPGMLVYCCDLREYRPATVSPPPNLAIAEIASASKMPRNHVESYSRFRSPVLIRHEIQERFRAGATCWIMTQAGNFVGLAWSIVGKTREKYFFPLQPDEVHFFDFFVLPEFRGKGFNPALVHYMLERAAAVGRERAYIETNAWNIAEQASLRKTPFRKIGLAYSFGLTGCSHVWWCGTKPAQAARTRATPATAADADPAARRGAGAGGVEAGKDGAAVKLTVAGSFEEIEPLREEWDQFAAECEGDVYMTFDWCRIWWKYYGAKRRLHILLFHSGGRLAGILPMFTETVWLGLSWLKVAKIVGSDFGLQVCSLLVRPESLIPVQTSLLEYFSEKCHCDVVTLAPLSLNKRRTQEMLCWSASRGHTAFRTVESNGGMQSVFVLPEVFEDYLKGIGKSQRGNYKRDCNLLAKSFKFTSDVVTAEASVETEFASFIAMHQAQWRAQGMMGHFADWPLASEFNAELARVMAAKGRVRFYRLLLDGKPVSYQYSFLFNQSLYWRLCARPQDEQWKRYGLGRMGLFKMIEAAIAEGVREIEAGRGRYEYKMSSGAGEAQLLSLAFVRRRLGATARFYVFQVCSKALNIVYYKILVHRVYPRLRFLRRPLARIWIRAQF